MSTVEATGSFVAQPNRLGLVKLTWLCIDIDGKKVVGINDISVLTSSCS